MSRFLLLRSRSERRRDERKTHRFLPLELKTRSGAGLGITVFGIAYMFVHDGLVHRRFPVGPVARVPWLRRVAAAHRLHHTEKYGGAPFGMFLGPQELEGIPGATEELDRLVEAAEEAERASAAVFGGGGKRR